MRSSRQRTLGTLAVILVAALFGSGALRNRSAHGEGPPAASAAAPSSLLVDAVVATPRLLSDRVRATGTVLAGQEVEIVSELSRKVVRVAFEEGKPVAAGQLLVKLDDADLVSRLERLDVEKALAADTAKRMHGLLGEVVSQQDYDVATAREKMLDAEKKVLRVDLAKTEIRAPFAGRVGLKRVYPGAFVSPSTLLTTVEALREVKVDFALPEKYASLVSAGKRVTFTIAGRAAPFTGVVSATEPKVNVDTRSLVVRAVAANPDGALLPGMSATLELELAPDTMALLVPTQALLPTAEGANVFVVNGGKAELRPVKVGQRTKSEAKILSGLHEGDVVATTNLLRLAPGASVEIAPKLAVSL